MIAGVVRTRFPHGPLFFMVWNRIVCVCHVSGRLVQGSTSPLICPCPEPYFPDPPERTRVAAELRELLIVLSGPSTRKQFSRNFIF